MTVNKPYAEAVDLLQKLIALPSFSREEDKTASLIEGFFSAKNIPAKRLMNNVWCVNKHFDADKPSLLLNSHHDTVKPNPLYTIDPFLPLIEDGKLFGLGSNDAGGCLVSLMAAFCHFYAKENLKYNIVFAATAEEEISGANGMEKLLASPEFMELVSIEAKGKGLAGAIVGEPTLTNLAIAEKGLLVLDCMATGKAGHAAREEGDNAIYKAIQDIFWFQNYCFPELSETLGPVKMTVTSIESQNKAHNMVPAVCTFVVDIRVTDAYTHEAVLETIQKNVQSEVKPRSMRLRASKIEIGHPLVQAGIKLGKKVYGSPTTSDAALIQAPVLKCGPGNSARSHTADEFIYLSEIEAGIDTYINILEQIV